MKNGGPVRDHRHKIKNFSSTREKLHEIIFEADTRAGKNFDIALLIAIIISVVVVMLDSVPSLHDTYGNWFIAVEWVLTVFFTIEYILRLYCVYRPMKYATSFFGIVDLIAIIPTYLSFFMVNSQSIAIVRALRLLRIFRIFKLGSFLSEGTVILTALKSSKSKISVFLFAVLILVSIFGSIMYVIEGGVPDSKFDSIPRSIYWAIVTLTTVGYGDISPVTHLGQFLASMIMIMGYAIIAVPTGIVSAEAIKAAEKQTANHTNTQVCRYCADDDHDDDAHYCKSCGEELNSHKNDNT